MSVVFCTTLGSIIAWWIEPSGTASGLLGGDIKQVGVDSNSNLQLVVFSVIDGWKAGEPRWAGVSTWNSTLSSWIIDLDLLTDITKALFTSPPSILDVATSNSQSKNDALFLKKSSCSNFWNFLKRFLWYSSLPIAIKHCFS